MLTNYHLGSSNNWLEVKTAIYRQCGILRRMDVGMPARVPDAESSCTTVASARVPDGASPAPSLSPMDDEDWLDQVGEYYRTHPHGMTDSVVSLPRVSVPRVKSE